MTFQSLGLALLAGRSKVEQLEIFVLDEADRMLDMGFIHDVRKILKWLPRKKQTMLFSATMPPEIAELVNSLLRTPVQVAVDPVSSPVEAIRSRCIWWTRAIRPGCSPSCSGSWM